MLWQRRVEMSVVHHSSLHDDICKLILISSSIHYSDLVNKTPPMQLSRIKGLALFNITYAFENLWVPTSLHWWFTNSIARVFFLCVKIYIALVKSIIIYFLTYNFNNFSTSLHFTTIPLQQNAMLLIILLKKTTHFTLYCTHASGNSD